MQPVPSAGKQATAAKCEKARERTLDPSRYWG